MNENKLWFTVKESGNMNMVIISGFNPVFLARLKEQEDREDRILDLLGDYGMDLRRGYGVYGMTFSLDTVYVMTGKSCD